MDIQRVNGVLTKAISLFQNGEIEALSGNLQERKRKGPKRKKHPHATEVKRAGKLDAVDPLIAKVLVKSGLKDGSLKDDVVKVSKKSWAATSLKPSQNTMILDKALAIALLMLQKGKVGGDLGVFISKDRQIMDGHHRWAGTIFASGDKGKVGGYGADINGKRLLRLLNVLTKGAFNVRGGKAGQGDISTFTPENAKKALTRLATKGLGGPFSWSGEAISKVLKDAFGSVEKGIETMAARADMIPKQVPGWAPDRKQMPVIEPGQVDAASKALKKGEIDWKHPFAKVGS